MRCARQVLDLQAFNEYNEKSKSHERSVMMLRHWKEDQLAQRKKVLRVESTKSREVFQRESKVIDPLLYDPSTSSIARMLQSERKNLLSSPLPRNKHGVDVCI